MPISKLHSFTIQYDHSEEYHRLKQEIFTQDSYYFETDNAQPVIIDAGAHIGLATLYFKRLYPVSHIIAIEPQPDSFKLLEANVFENQLDDVETHQVALTPSPGQVTLYQDATAEKWLSTAGINSGAWNGIQKSTGFTVLGKPLAEFLQQPVDFLKLDIEGAEQAVLQATGDDIQQVKHLVVEFHPTVSQSLPRLLEWLESQGFTTQLWKDHKAIAPKVARGLVLIEAKRR